MLSIGFGTRNSARFDRIVTGEQIECDYSPRGWLRVAESAEEERALAGEVAAFDAGVVEAAGAGAVKVGSLRGSRDDRRAGLRALKNLAGRDAEARARVRKVGKGDREQPDERSRGLAAIAGELEELMALGEAKNEKVIEAKPLADDDVPQTVEVRTIPVTEPPPEPKPADAPRSNGAASEPYIPTRAPDDPGIEDDEPAPRAKPAPKTGTAA